MIREPTPGDRLTADYMRGLVREVRRCRIVAGYGLRLTSTDLGSVVSLAQPPVGPARQRRGWPFGRGYAFGIVSIIGAVVTVGAGTIELASPYTASETAIEITGLGQYIGLECVRSTGACSITGPHATRPARTAEVYKTALYVFDLIDGVAIYVRECINDIRLEAVL
jgi:hypothetical protein